MENLSIAGGVWTARARCATFGCSRSASPQAEPPFRRAQQNYPTVRHDQTAREIGGDEVMVAALIDRLVHHCHIVNIRKNSYRMRDHQNLLQSGSDRRRKKAA